MDLDRRARRAAADLHRSVTDLDLGAVHAEVVREGARRRHRARQARAALLGAAAVFLVGAFAVVVLVGGDEGDPGRSGDRAERVETERPDGGPEAGDAGYASQMFDGMPATPTDGKQSWRLPVLAEPQHDLEDGDVVTLYGRGYEPNESLGIVHCTSEADTGGAGVGACQLNGDDGSTYGGVTYANADPDGNVVATVVVRRFVTLPDGSEVDCASAAERCLLGMGAVSNYDRSGGAYIDFADAPDFAEPSMAITPEGPIVPGEPVTVSLRGMVPLRSTRLSTCLDDLCVPLADVQADEDGAVDQVVTLQPALTDPVSGRVVACEDRCTLRAAGIGPSPVLGAMASSAPLPDDVPLTFTTDVASPTEPQTTAPDTATTTSAVEATGEGPTATTAPDPAPEGTPGAAPDTVPGDQVEATTVPLGTPDGEGAAGG